MCVSVCTFSWYMCSLKCIYLQWILHQKSYEISKCPDKINNSHFISLAWACLLNIWLSVPYCSGIIDWKKSSLGLSSSLSHCLCPSPSVTLPLTYPATLGLIYSQDPPLFHRDSFSDDFHPILRILDSMYFVFLCRWWMICVKKLLSIRRRRCCDDGEAVRVRARRIEAQQSPALDLQPWASDWTPTADYLTTTLRYIPILAIHTNVRYVFKPLLFKYQR